MNSHLLKGVTTMAELTKTDARQSLGKIKPTDKNVMMPGLFDGTIPETSKQHYERFNMYIKFQTKSGHLTDPVREAIDLFEHTLDKTALVWFQTNRSKFKDLTTLYSHFTDQSQDFDWFDRLHYIYQHFQDSKMIYQLDPETEIPVPDDDSLYPYINNDIKYGLFEDIVDSYYLDSQIKDDFQCDQDCYTHQQESTVDNHSISCTHAYDHIVQQIQDLSDSTQQHTLHSMEENASLFTNDSTTPCDFNITNQNSVTDNTNDTNISHALKQFSIHSQSKHKYRNTFGKSNIQYHDFDNQDALTFTDNTPHYYNKNYKIHIGVYMTQLQLKVTKFQKIWTLRLCHMQCTSLAIQTQSQRSITYHTKQLCTMRAACLVTN